jgi:hypothetical protein
MIDQCAVPPEARRLEPATGKTPLSRGRRWSKLIVYCIRQVNVRLAEGDDRIRIPPGFVQRKLARRPGA